MKKHSMEKDWQNLLDNILFSGTNVIRDVLDAGKDVYKTWFKTDAINNTPLHRKKERNGADGTEDLIK